MLKKLKSSFSRTLHFYRHELKWWEWLVIGGAFFLTIFFVVVMPPSSKTDEMNHYRHVLITAFAPFCDWRTVERLDINDNYWQLSNMVMFKYPVNDNKFKMSFFPKYITDFSFNEEQHTPFTFYPSCEKFPRIPYFFASLPFMMIGDSASGSSVLFAFYSSRLINALIFFICVLLAIKWIPSRARPLLYGLITVPMILSQAGSLGYDSLQFSCIILLFALFVKFAFKFKLKGEISVPSLILFLALLIILQLVKPGYYPFVLLFAIFPLWKYINFKKYLIIVAVLMAGACLPVFSQSVASIFLNDKLTIAGSDTLSETAQHVAFVKGEPFYVLAAFISTLIENHWQYFATMTADFYYLIDGLSPIGYFSILLIQIICVICYVKNTKQIKLFNLKQLLLLAFIMLSTIFCFMFAMYIYNTNSAAAAVYGVNGRYFIPLLPFFLLFLGEIIKTLGNKKSLSLFLLCAGMMITLNIITGMYKNYYNYQKSFYKENDFSNYANSLNQGDITFTRDDYIKLDLDPAHQVNGLEFYFKASDTNLPIYQYQLFDEDCQQVLEKDFLMPQTFTQSENNIARIIFKKRYNFFASRLCMKLVPMYPRNESSHIEIGQYNGKILAQPLYSERMSLADDKLKVYEQLEPEQLHQYGYIYQKCVAPQNDIYINRYNQAIGYYVGNCQQNAAGAILDQNFHEQQKVDLSLAEANDAHIHYDSDKLTINRGSGRGFVTLGYELSGKAIYKLSFVLEADNDGVLTLRTAIKDKEDKVYEFTYGKGTNNVSFDLGIIDDIKSFRLELYPTTAVAIVSDFHVLSLDLDQYVSEKDKFLAEQKFAPTTWTEKLIEGNAACQQPECMLYVRIPYDQKWRAEVNGEKVTVENINLGFVGIRLPEGDNAVRVWR